MIYKTLHRKLNIEQHEPHQKQDEHSCSGVSFSLFNCVNEVAMETWMKKTRFHHIPARRITFRAVISCGNNVQ